MVCTVAIGGAEADRKDGSSRGLVDARLNNLTIRPYYGRRLAPPRAAVFPGRRGPPISRQRHRCAPARREGAAEAHACALPRPLTGSLPCAVRLVENDRTVLLDCDDDNELTFVAGMLLKECADTRSPVRTERYESSLPPRVHFPRLPERLPRPVAPTPRWLHSRHAPSW